MAGNPVKLGRPARYEDLLAVPEHQVAEILDGDLYVTPRPAFPHAFAAGMVYRDVVPFHGPGGGRRGPGGWWILFEPELHFGRAIAVPDLAGWRIERMPVFPGDAFSEVVPVAGTFGAEGKVRAEPFPDLEIDLAGWWPPVAEAGPTG